MSGRVPFSHPEAASRVPLPALPYALWKVLAYRGMPLSLSVRIVAATQSCYLRRRREWAARQREELHTLMPDAPPQVLRDSLLRSRVLRRLGGHMLSPILWRSPHWLRRTFRPQGLDVLADLKATQTGALILGTHVGYNGWVGPLLIELGYPVRLMQRRRISTEKLLTLRLKKWTSRVLPYPEEGEEGIHLKLLHDLLKEGEWIQHVADSAAAEGAVTGRLFGHDVFCCRGPWVLARLSGAPAVPVLIVADDDLRPQLLIGAPIQVDAAVGPREHAMATAFQSYLDFLEKSLTGRRWNLSPHTWGAMTRLRQAAD